MSRLTGQLAVVTGASSGIGAATARALAAEGAGVLGLARRFRAAGAQGVPAAGQVLHAPVDVTDEAAVEATFAALPAVDVVVCCAGHGVFAPVARTRTADLREMLEVHIVGTFLVARAALRSMAARRGGHLVVVASVAAQRAFPDCAAYTAAKAGQLGLARVLAEEARPLGVRVTSVLPGATDTPIWDDRPGFDRTKMLRPEDVAGVIVDLVARPGVAVEEVAVTPPGGAL